MIISKMIINAVAGKLVKHFKLDKIMSYVFEDNNLDKELKKVKRRIKVLENLSNQLDLEIGIKKLENKKEK